jgi:hypothetical protein
VAPIRFDEAGEGMVDINDIHLEASMDGEKQQQISILEDEQKKTDSVDEENGQAEIKSESDQYR